MMTKDEKKYFIETLSKLNLNYTKVYDEFFRKMAWVIVDTRDLRDIRLEILEMFYRNQRIGNKVEEVIGGSKEEFLNNIIESYYENTSKLKIMKDILLNRGLGFCLAFFILFFINGYRSIIILLAIPISILLSTLFYLVNRYIKNNLITNTLNIFMLLSLGGIYLGLDKVMSIYKNAYMIPKSIVILFIIGMPIVLVWLHKKNKLCLF